MPCITPIPLDMAAQHSETMFNTATIKATPLTCLLEAIEEWSGQQRAGGGLEGEEQPVPCPPPEAELSMSFLLGAFCYLVTKNCGRFAATHELTI